MTRKPLTTKQRVELFKAHGGVCHICKGLIHPGKAWEVEHIIPIALGGVDAVANMAPAHKECHASKTAQGDVPAIAKAKRREARHIGATMPPKQPIRSASFAKRERTPKPALPPRQMYEDAR